MTRTLAHASTASALVSEAVVVHSALTIGMPATARRAALAAAQHAQQLAASIDENAVDRDDSDLDDEDLACWVRAARGIGHKPDEGESP